MKIFAFIMGIIVIVVSTTPCKDLSLVIKAKKAKTEFAKETSHGHQERTDACSPFCSCSCCSANPCPQAFTTVICSAPEVTIQHSSLYFGSLITISLPIWQPPQLVA